MPRARGRRAASSTLIGEQLRRRRRSLHRLDRVVDEARAALARGEGGTAGYLVRQVAFSRPMADALDAIVEQHGRPDAEDRIAKRLADTTTARCGGWSGRGSWSGSARRSA